MSDSRAYMAAWHLAHRKKRLADMAKWHADHREGLLARYKARYQRHREAVLARARARYAADPQTKRDRVAAYRATAAGMLTDIRSSAKARKAT